MRALAVLSAALTLCSHLSANNEVALDSYLSNIKQEEFKLDYERVDNESSALRDAWIMPVNLNYSLDKSNPYSKMQTSQRASVVIDQPIFKSGGIIYGIKFAQASRKFANLSIDQQRQQLIKTAVELLMQIKKTSIQLQQQEYRVKNADINLAQKKELYLNGQLDSGFLTNAVIEKNNAEKTLFDMQRNQQSYLSQFEAISDMDPSNAPIPQLRLLSEDEFLQNNIDLNKIKSQTQRDDYNKNMQIARYLPSINLTGGYNWTSSQGAKAFNGTVKIDDSEDKYYNYGLKATMPLDVNSYNNIQIARIEYLKSRVMIDDTSREQKALFERVMQNIDNLDKKIVLAKENIDLYSSLYNDTKVLYQAGYKTLYDVEMLENSVKIEEYEMKIVELDKQLTLLYLYEKLSSI